MDSNQPTENRWNQIDRYVGGDMQGEERNLFEQRMREHAGLAQQVHLHRDILGGMEYHFAQQLKEQLALSDQAKKKLDVRRLLQIAAAVLLVAGLAGAAYYYLLQPTDPQQVFLAYFEPYPNTLASANRGEATLDEAASDEAASDEAALDEATLDEATSDEEQTALRYYEAGNYPQAIAAFTRLLTSDTTSEQQAIFTFYRGIAYLGAGQPEEALTDFQTVTPQSDTLLAESVTWYTGLSYLRMGQVAPAKQRFEQLRDAGGNYAEPAAKLLDDLG